ncbi:MAG: hypothetical protein ACUVUQ_10715 [Thermodesulfovibrionales bacterium]
MTMTAEYVKLYTFLYRAERGASIHNALMNREATSKVASILTGILFIWYAMQFGAEKPLEAIFSRTYVTIKYSSFLIKRGEIFKQNQVKSLSVQKRKATIENPEGVKIVKHVVFQHGTAIPDLVEPSELYMLELRLDDNTSRIIYAD